MTITVRNNTSVANKYVRFIKWKIYQLKEKFKHLLYAETHINSEGNRYETYIVNLRLGVPGKDIIIKKQSDDIRKICRYFDEYAHRYLSKRHVFLR